MAPIIGRDGMDIFFSKMEGKFDSLSTGSFSGKFTFHTGLDENYKIVKLDEWTDCHRWQ